MQNGETPLMIAAHEGEEAVVKVLLAKRANVQAKDEVVKLSTRFQLYNQTISTQMHILL